MIKKESIDLIVMGTSGLSGLTKIKALGSVSRNVIENVKVPSSIDSLKIKYIWFLLWTKCTG